MRSVAIAGSIARIARAGGRRRAVEVAFHIGDVCRCDSAVKFDGMRTSDNDERELEGQVAGYTRLDRAEYRVRRLTRRSVLVDDTAAYQRPCLFVVVREIYGCCRG